MSIQSHNSRKNIPSRDAPLKSGRIHQVCVVQLKVNAVQRASKLDARTRVQRRRGKLNRLLKRRNNRGAAKKTPTRRA